MNPFISKKLKEKLEKYERELADKSKQLEEKEKKIIEKDEELLKKELELAENQKMFVKYKNESDSRRIKNEEIIAKLSERWDVLENNLIQEEQLRGRLDQEKNAQEAMLKKLETENEIKTKLITEYEENINQQNDKMKHYENELKQSEKENEQLKKELESKSETISNHIKEVQIFQQRCENLEKEIVNLNTKIDFYQVEMENKRIQIEHLYSESNIKAEKVRGLENKLLNLEEIKVNKVEMERKEEVDRLKKIIDCKKRELQDKTKQIESFKNKAQQIIDMEKDLKELNDQNIALKKEIDEKNKSIKTLKHEILNKDNHNNELQSQIDSIRKDLNKQEDLVNELESNNKTLQKENQNILEQHGAENHKYEETVKDLKEKDIHNEKIIKAIQEKVKTLENKLKELEQENENLKDTSKMEIQKYKDAFKSLELSKNTTIENLESSEKRALECLCQKNETIKYLEKDLTDKESDLNDKEQEISVLKNKLDDLVKNNEILEFKVRQMDEIKNEEVENIDFLVSEQVKAMNDAYQLEWETREHQRKEFINDLEYFVSKQIVDHETQLRVIDNLKETTEQLIEKTNNKIEAYTTKMKDHKIHMESLQRLINELEVQNEDIKKEIVQKDITFQMHKKKIDDNYKLLQNEILKSEIGETLLELGHEMNASENNSTPLIENILRQIHTRNVVMRELREDNNIKQDIIIRLQEKYQRLSEKIKRVVVTVTNAKIAYQELEKENRRLKKFLNELTDERSNVRLCNKAGTTTLSEAYSDYDIRVRRDLPDTSDRSSDMAPPLTFLCDELKSIKESSRKEILNLNQHTGLLTNIDFLKTEIQKERQLRKKQEELFTSVLNTIRTTSSKSQANNTTDKSE